VLLRTLFLSLDPYMRNLMDPIGPGYAPPIALGATMVGATVSRVVASRHAAFKIGDLVLANAGSLTTRSAPWSCGVAPLSVI
jgi:NADPH-dependent curcumin reductase CurA